MAALHFLTFHLKIKTLLTLWDTYMLLQTVTHLLVVFFFSEKKLLYVVTRDVCPSVCPSVRPSVRPSVCPSSVEISLERGCSITNMPIDLKFGPIIGGQVIHV